MLNNFAATQAGGTGTVTTTTILDSTIINEDVDDDAAIDLSKLSHGTDQKLGIGIIPTETLHVRDTRTSADSAALLIQKPGVVSGAGTHSYGMYVESAGAGTNFYQTTNSNSHPTQRWGGVTCYECLIS